MSSNIRKYLKYRSLIWIQVWNKWVHSVCYVRMVIAKIFIRFELGDEIFLLFSLNWSKSLNRGTSEEHAQESIKYHLVRLKMIPHYYYGNCCVVIKNFSVYIDQKFLYYYYYFPQWKQVFRVLLVYITIFSWRSRL